jgi:hypothetical protein
MPRGKDKGDPNKSQTRQAPEKDKPATEPKKKRYNRA